jgi:aminoglycoside phosphotransferase (APT) family kinase protein
MNKILQLFDEKFALDYLRNNLLPLYPTFKDIRRVEIEPYKKMVWETTYHVVICFQVYFLNSVGKETKIPNVCSAHSDEPRENVFLALNYLWDKKFPGAGVDIPRPLFYSEQFNGTFYRALKGKNLLHYIKQKDFAEVEKGVIAAAQLFAKLHALPAGTEANFNPINSRIRTVIPGTTVIFQEMTARYGNKYISDLENIYNYFMGQEEKFFNSSEPLKLIHGDAHSENIIKTAADRVGIIDFTDLCLGDFARDIGTFLQQLEYKIVIKASDQAYAVKMKQLFLDNYLQAAGLTLNNNLQARIDLYYNWTAIRTATYWFLKFGHNEERAEALLRMVKANLKLEK